VDTFHASEHYLYIFYIKRTEAGCYSFCVCITCTITADAFDNCMASAYLSIFSYFIEQHIFYRATASMKANAYAVAVTNKTSIMYRAFCFMFLILLVIFGYVLSVAYMVGGVCYTAKVIYCIICFSALIL